MVAILQTKFSNAFSCMTFFMKILLKFVHKGPVHNKPALVQVMPWHRTGDKP